MNGSDMRTAFIRDIAENPEDMTPRLIFADWLEENGEPERAEFIRVQIEMWGLVALSERRMDYLKRRERELADAVGYSYSARNISLWAGKVVNRIRAYQGVDWKFRNGFIEEVHAPLSVLEEHLPALVQEHPILSVRATDIEPRNHGGYYVSWSESLGIPADVFRLMEDDNGDTGADTDRLEYDTGCSAHAALSKALLKFARGK